MLETDESIRERVSIFITLLLFIIRSIIVSSQYYRNESQPGMPGSDKAGPATETMPEFAARCLAWYERSIQGYMISAVKKGDVVEEPRNILVVSHGGCVLTLFTELQAKGAVTCREGVKIGYCLNTGVSVIEYTDIPSGGEIPLVGTVVQYSDIEHLTRNNLSSLEVNADVLGAEWFRP